MIYNYSKPTLPPPFSRPLPRQVWKEFSGEHPEISPVCPYRSAKSLLYLSKTLSISILSHKPLTDSDIHTLVLYLHPIMRGWLSTGNPAAAGMGRETVLCRIMYRSASVVVPGPSTTVDWRRRRLIRSPLDSASWHSLSFYRSPPFSISRCKVKV